jgi:hypothetical protein
MGFIRSGGEASSSGRRHNPHARSSVAAEGGDNVARCPVCEQLCFLTTDGNGRLKAYDEWPHRVHPHTEVLKGPGDPIEVDNKARFNASMAKREGLTDDDVLDIIYSTEPPRILAEKYDIRVMYIHEIQMGHRRPMPGVDYEATQKERDAARNERARQKSREALEGRDREDGKFS